MKKIGLESQSIRTRKLRQYARAINVKEKLANYYMMQKLEEKEKKLEKRN